MYGVTSEYTKLNSHCVLTPTEVPISRMRVGKILKEAFVRLACTVGDC